jgi:radical SAM superfamily enzyme YgiQ (UPF0313 family)
MIWKLKQRQQQWLTLERGAILKDWGGKVPVALAFPNRYAVGMSSLGLQSVYGFMNGLDTVVCERVFYPEPEDLPLVRQHPGHLLSVESQRPLNDFELLAFSVAFENDYPNLVEMLVMAGFPPYCQDRPATFPLVAAGGIAACLNPETLAPFIDFFFVGEAEILLPAFWQAWHAHRDRNQNRRDLLRHLAREVPGIYVPSFYEAAYHRDGTLEAVKAVADVPQRIPYQRADLTHTTPCRTVVFTPKTEFSNVGLLEIGRGCGRGCRFCAAGFVCRPPRYHSLEKLIPAAQSGMERTTRIGLLSAAVSDHPEIAPMCRSLMDCGASLSFSSVRADSVTPELLAALKLSRHKAIAIAPDAGSERLRQVINKNLSADQIYSTVEKLVEAGILNLKLYFMIGLPTETLDDLEAIVDLTKRIKHHVLQKSRGQKRLGTITLSVNAFVPKPFTPFQWEPFAGVKQIKERAGWIKTALRKIPNVRVHFDLAKWAYLEALFTRGDRRVALFLEEMAVRGSSLSRALQTAPFNPDFWVLRQRVQDELFPWEIIDHGLNRSYLWDEYQRALQGKSSVACQPQDCRRCGVCG